LAAHLAIKNAAAVTRWRIRWIELEHDSARALGREPRDINTIFRQDGRYCNA
jgi:hypothetical protein